MAGLLVVAFFANLAVKPVADRNLEEPGSEERQREPVAGETAPRSAPGVPVGLPRGWR
jgi:hypothetical protein